MSERTSDACRTLRRYVVELDWLAAHARRHRTIVEIGSFMGRSTMALAETPGTVYAVDTWKGSPGEYQHQAIILDGRDEDFLYDSFRLNLRAQIVSGKVIPYRAESLFAARGALAVPFDMIFIDGAHDYESVRSDILAWRPLLAPGGFLCGHDIDWTDVRRAVDELVPAYEIFDTIWYHEDEREGGTK